MLDDDNGRTAALSDLVLLLHRGCRTWPAATFKDRACDLLADILPFDAAVWCSENATTLQTVALHRYRVADGTWAAYLTLGCQADPLLSAARAAPEAAVALTFVDAATPPQETLADGAIPPTPPGFFASQGMSHGMAVARLEPLSRLRSVFSLWRGAGGTAFSANDQRLLQFLAPHLIETARESLLARAVAGTDAGPSARSHAVCDATGVLLHLDDRSLALFRLEWPQWAGGALPAPLVQAVQQAEQQAEQQAGTPSFAGRRIVVRMAAHGDTVLLAVRLRAAHDRLSSRQRGIAELYASGCTGTEIAQRLGLAASTVNNHLGEIFKKLQVNSKVQLARTLQNSVS